MLEAEDNRGPLGVAVVPVGLIFDAKGKFRSRALVQIGDPVDTAAILETYLNGDHQTRREAVRELTTSIDDGLGDVTLKYDSWEEARLIARAACDRGSRAHRGGLSASRPQNSSHAACDPV